MFFGTSGRGVKYLILSCSKGVVAHFNLVTQRNKVRALTGKFKKTFQDRKINESAL